jgi:hypothetical protein
MKVSPNDPSQNQQKRLESTRQRLIQKKEREIAEIDKLYKGQVEEIRKDRAEKVEIEYEKNKEVVNEALIVKEQRLENIRKDLKAANNRFDDQKQLAEENNKQKIINMNSNFDNQRKELFINNLEINKDIEANAKTTAKNIQFETEQGISKVRDKARLQAMAAEKDTKVALMASERQSMIEKKAQKIRHAEELNTLERNHNERVGKESKKNKIDYHATVESQRAEIKHLEAHHADILKQKRASFKQKYDLLEKSQKDILTRIKDRFNKEIKTLVSKYSDFKNQTLSKTQDDFYHVSKLEPAVQEMPDHYLVSIEVPEHEKELVRLTAQKRNIRVSLSRQFRDDVVDPDKSENSTKRSEVLTKAIDVEKVLDSRHIQQKYDEGILTFKIAKL